MADQPDATTVRALRSDDDLDALLDLAERAFGPMPAHYRDRWRQQVPGLIAQGQYLGAFAGDRIVAAAMFHDMRQSWCGRAMPMAGVSAVKVAPEDRGRGVGRRLMAALLDEMAARGYPLSALYPATMPLYRSLGWELAGARDTAVIPARSLRDLVPPDPAVGQAVEGSPRLRRAASDAAPLAAPGGPGLRRLTRGRPGPGRGVRRDGVHARRLLSQFAQHAALMRDQDAPGR